MTLGKLVTIQHFTSWYSSVNVPEEKRVAVGHTTASVQRLREPAGTRERRGSWHEGQAAGRRGDSRHTHASALQKLPSRQRSDHTTQRGESLGRWDRVTGSLPSQALIRELCPLPLPANTCHRCSWVLGLLPSGSGKKGIRGGNISPRKEWPISLSLWGEPSSVFNGLGAGVKLEWVQVQVYSTSLSLVAWFI